MNLSFTEYNEAVMNYLEYLGYPELVAEFDPLAVAMSLSEANLVFYYNGVSIRYAALCNFGLTWTMQIVPSAKDMRQH